MNSLIYIHSCGLNITKPNSTTLGVSTNYQYYHWRCGAIYLGELENFRQQKNAILIVVWGEVGHCQVVTLRYA